MTDLRSLAEKRPAKGSENSGDLSFQDKLTKLADEVAEALEADVFLYSGPIKNPADSECIMLCQKTAPRRSSCLLILATFGGAPEVAYRIARSFRRSYERFIVCVDGHCASAGTLIALGSHELIISDHGMMGPLDTQIAKTDELWVMSSGLTGLIALDAIRREAYEAFEESLVQLKVDLPNQLTLRTAMETAVKLTTGLFAPVYAQIDPMKLGEDQRALDIAEQYGRRLSKGTNNVKNGTIQRLLAQYPSHSFIIDREEASELFNEVRIPTDKEQSLLEHISAYTRTPAETPGVFLLSTLTQADENSYTADDDCHVPRQDNEGDSKGTVPQDGHDFEFSTPPGGGNGSTDDSTDPGAAEAVLGEVGEGSLN